MMTSQEEYAVQKFKQLMKRPGIRYLFVGGSVYVLELVVILIAQRAGSSAPVAVGIAYMVGTAVSFFLQKLVTFGDKRMHHKILIPQLIATILLVAWNFVFSVAVTKIFEDHAPAVVIRTVALAITVIWNFYLYKTKIFKRSDTEVIG